MKDKDFEQWLTREEVILKVEKEVDDWCENDVFVNELYKRYRQLEKDIKEISKSKIEELFHDASVLAGTQNRSKVEEVRYCELKKVVGFYLDLTSEDLDKIVEITNDYKEHSKNFNVKYGLADDESLTYKNLSEANAELEKDKQKALDCFETACGALRVIREDNADLLALLTTDEIDNSTLIECLTGVRIILINHNYTERSEELCVWVEKLKKHKGESE